MITLRFDMRAPATGAPATELYSAAVEMCAWAETRGAFVAVLSEHHAAQDGHLPAPLLLHDAMTAAAYRHGDNTVASISRARSVEELRAVPGPYRIFTVDEAAAYVRGGRKRAATAAARAQESVVER